MGPVAGGGDPNGLEITETAPAAARLRSLILPSPWAGLPDGWQPLFDNPRVEELTDTAWMCMDLNASIIASMPPYLVNAAPSTPSDWLTNPDPDIYASWEEFAKTLIWDYGTGEAFVYVTARYHTGWPARFHVIEPWLINVEIVDGLREYSIGGRPLDRSDVIHLRYKSTRTNARGIGPLEVGRYRLIAAAALHRYAMNYVSGTTPHWLETTEDLTAADCQQLQDQWLMARTHGWGIPAVLDLGTKWNTATGNPRDLALVDLSQYQDSRIAVMLGVPPFLAGLPSGGDSMTYSNVISLFDYHWRAGLRPKVTPVMSGLSAALLPRATRVEVNRDSYVQPGPADRASFYQIMFAIGAMTVEQVQAAERILNTEPAEIQEGVLR